MTKFRKGKMYLRCIDTEGTHALEQWKVYLCEATSIYGTPAYKVWEEDNTYVGQFGAVRFVQIGTGKEDVRDYGIERLKEKAKEYNKLKAKLRVLKEDINQAYKSVGKQLNLPLKE